MSDGLTDISRGTSMSSHASKRGAGGAERSGRKKNDQGKAGKASRGKTEPTGFVVRPAGAKGKDHAVDLGSFVRATMPLLELEHEAELAEAGEAIKQLSSQSQQKRGIALNNLKCDDLQGGLLGKTLVQLVSAKVGDTLPAHKMTPHDVVEIRKQKGTGVCLAEAVVTRVQEKSITVAVEELPEESFTEGNLRLVKLANTVSHKRLKAAMTQLSHDFGGGSAAAYDASSVGSSCEHARSLVRVAFGEETPRFAELPTLQAMGYKWKNSKLDDAQKDGVAMALRAVDIALIHGPPGTGKTTAVVEYILQEVSRGSRVLACAASNVAVDNLVERLRRASPKQKLVRVGHPARVLPAVLSVSLDALVMKSDSRGLADDVRKEMKDISRKLLKAKTKAERRDMQKELRKLGKECKQRERAAIDEVMASAEVVATTLIGAASQTVKRETFDVVVIDEAAQALECACWLGLLRARKAVLVGDHLQLPPTLHSSEAQHKGLAVTLFQRLVQLYGDKVTRMLTVQYRMNAQIMQWASDELYEGKLVAHPTVSQRHLQELEGIVEGAKGDAESASAPVLLYIDTSGCEDMEEEVEEEGDSKANPGEVDVVIAHVTALMKEGVEAAEIGIITPYNAQAALLKERRAESSALAPIEISSVDGFQGREKDAIVITMVRSNEKGEVGFLADNRRMNVAVTRARRQCALVCNGETVAHDEFLKRMVSYFEENGAYRSAMEYQSL
mmetsp:Transcript_9656/g.35382  ORF Transcript_9656/g.35382 Transcript_9656/m.35382 type:complete len:730 (+) Transcript_9656:147-2336(+)